MRTWYKAQDLVQAGGSLAAAAVCFVLLAAAPMRAQGGSAVKRGSVPATATTPQPAPAPTLPKVPGTELDRVVAIVNGDLVLDSDVAEEQRFVKLQPTGLTGTSPTFNRDQAIERLINRDLILQQAKLETADEISDADVDKDIAGLRKGSPGCEHNECATDAGWARHLTEQGFTAEAFRDRWRMRMQVLAFVEERFRSGIRISDADIKSYYDKTLLPAYAKQHDTAPKLDVVSPRIQEVLLQGQVSSLLGDWLRQLRAQGSVAVLHPGEPAP